MDARPGATAPAMTPTGVFRGTGAHRSGRLLLTLHASNWIWPSPIYGEGALFSRKKGCVRGWNWYDVMEEMDGMELRRGGFICW